MSSLNHISILKRTGGLIEGFLVSDGLGFWFERGRCSDRLVHLSKDPFNICRLALRGLGIEISSSCRGRCEEI